MLWHVGQIDEVRVSSFMVAISEERILLVPIRNRPIELLIDLLRLEGDLLTEIASLLDVSIHVGIHTYSPVK